MHASIVYATKDEELAQEISGGLQDGMSMEDITLMGDENLDGLIPEADYWTAFVGNGDEAPRTIAEFYAQHDPKDTLQDIFLPSEFDLDDKSDPYCMIFKQREDGYQHFFKRYQKALESYLKATKMVGAPLSDIDMYERMDKLPKEQRDFVMDAKLTFMGLSTSRGDGRIALLSPEFSMIERMIGMDQQLVSSRKQLTYYVFPQQSGDFHF